ncbi:hypothetical protein [Lysobacter sp. TY2-98]|uniref:M61 family metallopeptidase n=1 Tax=Lysobacter sp. TY2-98 TaxID=2290922 RepID=UPI0013B3B596|nr:hypothetical protein [Lysobacter sp. TY2-98]
MRNAVLALVLGICISPAFASSAAGTYSVSWPRADDVRIHVNAQLPTGDDRLGMAQSWPGDAEPVASGGWPALVRNLTVRNQAGDACTFVAKGSAGWQLAPACSGALTIEYDVDYDSLRKAGWPAPREAMFRDANAVALVGRSLFITRQGTGAARVTFALPRGWHVETPWSPITRATFMVPSNDDLTDNLIAFSDRTIPRWSTKDVDLHVLTFGVWRDRESTVRRTLQDALRRYVQSMPLPRRPPYLVILLPQNDTGGESFRASFAMNALLDGTRENAMAWQGRLAHEVFHYWNGWRLRGADYASSQWFQEGFTEYMAATTLRQTDAVSSTEFAATFAEHLRTAGRLQTPLDTPGTHKGPPLYSGGALVALSWDALIRQSTGGHRRMDDVFAALWRKTDRGARAYTWSDIRASLDEVAPKVDWDALYARYVSGDTRYTADEVASAVKVVSLH